MSVLPKRILFIDHTASLGGGEIALLNLVRHLNVQRYRPLVLLFSDGPLRQRLQAAGIETHVMQLDPRVTEVRKDSLGLSTLLRLRDVGSSIGFVRRVARFIREHNVELVHTNSLKSDILGGIAARMARRPLIWHVRDRIEDDYLPRSVAFAFRRLCRIVPNVVFANSAATLNTLALHDPSRGKTVYSGIDLNSVADATDPSWQSLDIEPAAQPAGACGRLVGLVGRISPWKGQDVFIRAAATVHREFPDVRYQIIGSAMFSEHAYEEEVRCLVQELGLEEHVEFTGFREDVGEVIRRLHILVHASTTGEPFGQVIVEGMAAGKPVVATNGGGVPEIVVDGVTGLLVPMGDAGAMARAICQLLSDERSARQMGRAGEARVRERFTIQRTARDVEHVYDQIFTILTRRP